MMETKFDLIQILHHVENYVLLKKWDDFPAFLPGSDVDLLVADLYESSKKLQLFLLPKLDGEEWYLQVKEGRGKIHIDIIHEDNIFLRFDLTDSFNFRKFSISPAFKFKVFLDRINESCRESKIWVPSEEDNLLIRYFEYLEWFELNPSKIKHLNYILENADAETISQMIKNAHQFIQISHDRWEGEIRSINSTERHITEEKKNDFKNLALEPVSVKIALRVIAVNIGYLFKWPFKKIFKSRKS